MISARPVGLADYLFLTLVTVWIVTIIWGAFKMASNGLRWYEWLALVLCAGCSLGACGICWLVALSRILYQ
jgi:hypothetical protein